MVHDPALTTGLSEVLVAARSEVPLDDVMALFMSRTMTLLAVDAVHVRPLSPDEQRWHVEKVGRPSDGVAHDARFPVPGDPSDWGELQLTRAAGPFDEADAIRGRFLAELLGVVVASRQLDEPRLVSSAGAADPSSGVPHVHVPKAPRPRPEDLVSVVISCATSLDGMPDASTSSRLALVADRLAAVLRAPAWRVSLAHDDRVFEVQTIAASRGPNPAQPASVPIADVPARGRASAGGAFYADRLVGDPAARRELMARGHVAVIGAGGYDQDGRPWLVEVFADARTSRLEDVTPVLTAMVQSALCFPRDAVVPRPVEPAVQAILRRRRWLPDESVGTDLDATG